MSALSRRRHEGRGAPAPVPFVGRTPELAAMVEGLGATVFGRRALLVVEGESVAWGSARLNQERGVSAWRR